MKFFKLVLFASLFFLSGMTHPASAAFSDVFDFDQNYDAILYVQAQGIVSGYPDGTFKPTQSINRAEFTKIIVESMLGAIPEGQDPDCFPDVHADDWFYPYVCYAKQEGIISGYPDGTFIPSREISFAEASKIVVGAFGYFAVTTDDVWFRPFVEALEIRGAIPESVFSLTSDLTRGELAEIVYRLKLNIAYKPQLVMNEDFDLILRARSDLELFQDATLQTELLAAYERVRLAVQNDDYASFKAATEDRYNMTDEERAELESYSEAELEQGFHNSIDAFREFYPVIDGSLILGMKRQDEWAALFYKGAPMITAGSSEELDLQVRFFHLVNGTWLLNGATAAADITSDIGQVTGIDSRLMFSDEASKIRYLLLFHESFFLPNEQTYGATESGPYVPSY